MCGIVGYVGRRPVQDLLLDGLSRLEYRGYDSAGISMIAGDGIESVRAVGNLERLRDAVAARDELGGGVATAEAPATTGIGHTRWATHGRVNEENAHPHFDTAGRVHVVVNGIVENYLALKERLRDMGAVFTSDTDAEVIAHLVSHHLASGSLTDAVRAAYDDLEGHYAFVAMTLEEPDVIVGARKECPLIVGRGEGETFLASAIPAFLAHTRRVQYIENGEIVVVRAERRDVHDPRRHRARPRRSSRSTGTRRPPRRAASRPSCSRRSTSRPTRSPRRSPTAPCATTASTSTRSGALDEAILRDVKRVIVVACGTSYHAGLIGRYAIEEWARIPVEMDIASEYRYRNPVVGPGDLVIGITQSGETADTLAAMRIARERGATVLALTNVMGSQATRDADGVLYTRAGLEIGVAATKTFICQVAVMYLLGLQARRAARHDGRRPARRGHRRPQAHPALHRASCWRTSTRASRRSPTSTGTRGSSSTSAATSGCRWRSRAR